MNHLKYGCSTSVGNVRSHNEDDYRSEPGLGLWMVADGMGGHRGGETASAIAAEFIVEKTRAGKSIEDAIAGAHNAIKQASREGKGPEGMGTTVVALQTKDNGYQIAWVGDCRAYLWDGRVLTQLTKDHSYVQHLVDTGVISASESVGHPYQDVLIQALGAADMDEVNVEKVEHAFYSKEQILLCSDGLTKELEDGEIADILALEEDVQKKVDILIETALKNGGRDNITAILVSAGDDAPAKPRQGDTVPINAEELNLPGFLARVQHRVKQVLKVIFKIQ